MVTPLMGPPINSYVTPPIKTIKEEPVQFNVSGAVVQPTPTFDQYNVVMTTSQHVPGLVELFDSPGQGTLFYILCNCLHI